jgi:hypothetical protein
MITVLIVRSRFLCDTSCCEDVPSATKTIQGLIL